MHRKRRVAGKAGLVLLVAMLALSVAGIAAAQSSANFQLGCWGVISAGGDLHTISPSNHKLIDSIGQSVAGQSSSTSYTIRGGYLQPMGSGAGAATASSLAQLEQDESLYLPWISKFVRFVYTCPY